jgi:hypothetical protein
MKKILTFSLLLISLSCMAEKTSNVFQTIRFKNLSTIDVILDVDEDAKVCGLSKSELVRAANAVLNQSRIIKIDPSAEDYLALNITILPTSFDEERQPSCFFVTQIELNRLIGFKDKKIYASLWENSLVNYAASPPSEADSASAQSKKQQSDKRISNEKMIESVIQKLITSFLNQLESANP